jgi:glycerol-3-phosphate dehydrogenase
MTAADLRRNKLRRLREEAFDVLVIGGGINGAGIAREAALRGLKTALVDKGDFASGTSSRSSKLIHGGFRYLETGDFGLVFEASRERDLLRRLLAPHLVKPLRFFFPAYRRSSLPLWKMRLGLAIYDVFAAFRNIERHRGVRREEVPELEPKLRVDELRGGALYYDCFTDDSRLVLENILGAESAGAVCLNYAKVESLDKDGRGFLAAASIRDLDAEGGSITLRVRAVVNAAGPWLDRIRELDDPAAPPILRPTKGVHLVVSRDRVGNRNAIVLNAVRDRRILFVIPWDQQTIVGTTDTDYHGSLDDVVADAEDVGYLLETLNHYFPAARLEEGDVVSTFAGLRPLVAGRRPEAPSEVSREDAIFESDSGLVSLGGGKLTTYRRVAIKVVDRVARQLRRRFGLRFARRSGTAELPLPGADGLQAGTAATSDFASALERRYGARASQVMALLEQDPALAEPLDDAGTTFRGEVAFGARLEMAERVEDVLQRRTSVALRNPDGGASVAQAAAALMAEELDWSPATEHSRAREYLEDVVGLKAQWKRQA